MKSLLAGTVREGRSVSHGAQENDKRYTQRVKECIHTVSGSGTVTPAACKAEVMRAISCWSPRVMLAAC